MAERNDQYFKTKVGGSSKSEGEEAFDFFTKDWENENLEEIIVEVNIYIYLLNIVFFRRFQYIFRTPFSLDISVCTHARQVEHQRCSRTGRVQKNHKI